MVDHFDKYFQKYKLDKNTKKIELNKDYVQFDKILQNKDSELMKKLFSYLKKGENSSNKKIQTDENSKICKD